MRRKRQYPRPRSGRPHPLDHLGAGLAIIAIALLIFAGIALTEKAMHWLTSHP